MIKEFKILPCIRFCEVYWSLNWPAWTCLVKVNIKKSPGSTMSNSRLVVSLSNVPDPTLHYKMCTQGF